jgi:hypothetical protein
MTNTSPVEPADDAVILDVCRHHERDTGHAAGTPMQRAGETYPAVK